MLYHVIPLQVTRWNFPAHSPLEYNRDLQIWVQYEIEYENAGLEIATNTVANATNFSSLATKIVV